MVRMELVDAFTIVVIVAMFAEAYKRNQLNRKIDSMLDEANIQVKMPEFPKDIHVELMSVPTPPSEWSPGLGSYLNTRPMLIFFVIIIGGAALLTSIGLVATVPKMILAVLAVVLIVALHSGPDLYTLVEHFLQVVAQTEIGSLKANQIELLPHAKAHFKSWILLQVLFSLGLLVGVLLPIDLVGYYVLMLALIMFLALGSVYHIERGIFATPR
ncbi:MAG: hypothetical protein ACFFAX_14545 [Promethearchaeota archaeon]